MPSAVEFYEIVRYAYLYITAEHLGRPSIIVVTMSLTALCSEASLTCFVAMPLAALYCYYPR